MKYKYSLVLGIFLFLGFFGLAQASILGDSFTKLLESKSMNINSNINHSFKSGLLGSSNGKGFLNLNLNSKQDISKPGSIKAEQVFMGKVRFEGEETSLSTGFRLIGDTIYVQMPTLKSDSFLPEDISSELNLYQGQWIKISPQDVALLEAEYPEIKSIYDQTVAYNTEPNFLISRLNSVIAKYSPVFNLKKSGNRTVNGIKQDKYLITLNTTKLSNILFLDYNKLSGYQTPKERLQTQKEIKSFVSTFRFKNSYIFIGQKDKLPYQLSFSIDLLDDKKRVESTTKFDMTFSDFGASFDNVIVPPEKYISFTEFYNKSIKPKIEEMEKLSLESDLRAYRIWNEVVYDELNGKYGTASNNGSCTNPTLGSIFNKPLGDDLENSEYCNECSAGIVEHLIDSSGNEKRCYSTLDAYAVQMSYKNNSGYFCIDSTGQMKQTTSLITGPVCGN